MIQPRSSRGLGQGRRDRQVSPSLFSSSLLYSLSFRELFPMSYKEQRLDGKDPLVPITGLWSHQDRNGNTYFSGSSGGVRWLVLPVIGSNGDPDYRLYVSSGKPKSKSDEEGVYEEGSVAVG